MYCKVYSGGIKGISGYLVQVESDVSEGLPCFSMVGMPSSEVKEAGDRVRSAVKNCGFFLSPKRITINLSPADVRKEGSFYDLPIAISILMNFGYLSESGAEDIIFIGELSLDGSINPVNGVLPMIYAAKEAGFSACIVPKKNEQEAAIVDGMRVYGCYSLKEAVELLQTEGWKKTKKISLTHRKHSGKRELYEVDFADVNGQEALRRAAEVAAAGMHNLLMIGPPGSGKTMIARRVPTILPELSLEESIELTKIYSVAGCLPEGEARIKTRPFRAPHHTISPVSLTGGGRIPHPGEISLSSYGVLFLDELPEFHKSTLEVLRQPMEDRKVTISRVHGIYEFPTNFMMIAAMNPCGCGYYPDRERCHCRETDIQRYLGRISRPLLDRIDICMEAPQLSYEEMSQKRRNECSADIRARVERVHEIQIKRYHLDGITYNRDMGHAQIQKYCELQKEERDLMEQAFERLHLTARAYNRILKLARTIADLEGEDRIQAVHLSEAIGYRSMDRRYWR